MWMTRHASRSSRSSRHSRRNRFALVALGALVLASPARAQLASALAACSAKTDDEQRLACFDALAPLWAGVAPLATPTVGAATASPPADPLAGARAQWEVTEDQSKLDRSPRVIVARYSDDTRKEIAGLAARCIENTTTVVIALDSLVFGRDDQIRIQYRIGDANPIEERWHLSDSFKVVFAPAGAKSIQIMRQMAKSGDMYVRLFPDRGDPKTFGFDVRGFAEHLPKIAAACGWTP